MDHDNEFNEDEILDEEEDGELGFMEDSESPYEVRTAILTKGEMIGLLSLKTSDEGGVVVRIDPRESQPAGQTYEDSAAAEKWFNRSLATSRKNGWRVLYDGEALWG